VIFRRAIHRIFISALFRLFRAVQTSQYRKVANVLFRCLEPEGGYYGGTMGWPGTAGTAWSPNGTGDVGGVVGRARG